MHQNTLFESLKSPVESGGFGSDVIESTDISSYNSDELITKRALCRLFDCSERTIQRLAARRELPRPLTVAGRRVWAPETLGNWLADAARWKQAEINVEAARIRTILAERWRTD